VEGDTAGARKQILRGVADGPYGAVYHQVLLSVDSVESQAARERPAPPVRLRTSAAMLPVSDGGSATP
jgi:hypothetical protein